jgi:hypothetical protein
VREREKDIETSHIHRERERETEYSKIIVKYRTERYLLYIVLGLIFAHGVLISSIINFKPPNSQPQTVLHLPSIPGSFPALIQFSKKQYAVSNGLGGGMAETRVHTLFRGDAFLVGPPTPSGLCGFLKCT